MHRILVDKELLTQDDIVPPKDAAHHLKVLRPKPGEAIELFDGRGNTRVYHWNAVTGSLDSPQSLSLSTARPLDLTLFACVTKGSRWDWTIEKAVELGVSRIVPVISDRCIVRLDPRERAAKAERWRRIAEDAARQSDAVWLPEILAAVDFPAALDLVKSTGCVFVGALTSPPSPPLLTAVLSELRALGGSRSVATAAEVVPCSTTAMSSTVSSLGLFVGPEGDFTPEELKALLEIAVPTSFGPTILRAETAAIFGLSVLAACLASSSDSTI